MKKMIMKIGCAMLAIILCGCTVQTLSDSHNSTVSYTAEEAFEGAGVYMNAMADTSAAAPRANAKSAAGNNVNGGDTAPIPDGRKWIINMYISAETSDLDASVIAITERVRSLGGYIESQSTSGSAGSPRQYRSSSMTIRIPADHADAFAEQIAGMTNVVSSSRNMTDITLSYTDTAGRITALQTEEARLLELMSKAEDMSDLLAIEERLTEVRYNLETYSSRLRMYDNQIDYATIDLYMNQVVTYTPIEKPGFGNRVLSGLKTSFEDLGEFFVDAAAWLIIDLPYLLLIGVCGFCSIVFARHLFRKRKEKKICNSKK